MATTNGLPTLKITFEQAAAATISRAKQGIVGVIVRDAEAQGVYTLSSPLFIPEELGEENKAYIKTAFLGSDRGQPGKLVLLVIAEDTEDTSALAAGLALLETNQMDYLACPRDMTSEEETLLVTWVKTQRDELYRTVKLVKPFKTTGSDYMGIIELEDGSLKDKDGAITDAAYCARLAGIFAGLPMSMSGTYTPLEELAAVKRRTPQEQEDAINGGKLILTHDGVTARISRAVNSLTTVTGAVTEDCSKIKIVEGMDLIRSYLHQTIKSEYVGKFANTYNNKQLLVASIQDYFYSLESAGVLDPGSSFCEIDYDAQLLWLNQQGYSTADMSRQEILECSTGSWVFLRCGGHIVDSVEDFVITFNML